MNEGTMDTEFDRAIRLIWEDDSTTVMEATDLLKNAHVIEMRSLAKINGEMIEMQRRRIAEMEQLNCELNYIRRVSEDKIKELEQALRAEIDHSKQLVADCRTCKLVQKLEKSIQWYVDFANAQGKILTDEIQRANLAESLVDNLRSEVNAFQNDLALEKEENKRYRSQLSQRNGLVLADKAIK